MDAEELINRIRSGIGARNEVIRELYYNEKIRKTVVGTMIKKGCSEQQAKDLHVDSIVNFVKACYKPNFTIKTSLANYLTGIAKNIWYTQVTKSTQQLTIKKDVAQLTVDQSYEMVLRSPDQRELLNQLLDHLDETCKRLLTLWSLNKKMKEIAKDLNYKSDGMARKKKHQCLQRFYKIIGDHPNIVNALRELL